MAVLNNKPTSLQNNLAAVLFDRVKPLLKFVDGKRRAIGCLKRAVEKKKKHILKAR